MDRAIWIAIMILAIAYFKLRPRHWARDLVWIGLFLFTSLDAMARAALGLAYPRYLEFWCGFLIAMMPIQRREETE